MGIRERLEAVMNKGIKASKEALDRAKEKTKELGEKGVLKFKIMKLEHQAQEEFARLGARVYELLIEKDQNTISKRNHEIKDLLQKITEIEEKIEENEELMRKL